MKCTECEKWDITNQICTEGNADPDMAPDEDIYCGIMEEEGRE